MGSSKIIYQVDAFTEIPFQGNPAGVVVLDSKVSADWMQNIAMEMNLSETAFVFPKEDTFQIRFFTPVQEVALCGHATLASAHILYELGLKKEHESIVFDAQGGQLLIQKDTDGIRMTFPAYPIEKIDNHPDLKDSIGFEALATYRAGSEWIIAVAQNEDTIRKATPNFERMIANGHGRLIITATGNEPTIDYVERCFAPVSGIDEDPVTGSAQCALVPLWAQKTGKKVFNSLQVSKRSGRLKLKMNTDQTIQIQGQALTVFKATLAI